MIRNSTLLSFFFCNLFLSSFFVSFLIFYLLNEYEVSTVSLPQLLSSNASFLYLYSISVIFSLVAPSILSIFLHHPFNPYVPITPSLPRHTFLPSVLLSLYLPILLHPPSIHLCERDPVRWWAILSCSGIHFVTPLILWVECGSGCLRWRLIRGSMSRLPSRVCSDHI